MQLLITNPKVLTVEHAGQTLEWDMSNYDKKCMTGEYDITKHITQYWSRLPPHRQEKIFSIYVAIHHCLEKHSDMEPLVEGLLPLIEQLHAEHTLEELGHWITFYSDITIPDVFKEEYQQTDEKARPREKTYIRSDYRDLITMTLCLRTIVPVWGEFMKKMSRETGNIFKEFRAFQLLTKSAVMHSPPMEKLTTYVNRNIQTGVAMPEAIMKGVGSQLYPTWLLALAVVRRVCIGDLVNQDPKTNLVTFIFAFLNNKASNTNSNSFGDKIISKEFESGDANNDLNVSRIEGYKLKQEAPLGDMIILEFFMDDPFKVAKILKPDMDMTLLSNLLNAAQVLQKEEIWPHQIILTQWVLKPVFPPRGLTQLSKKATINAIAIAQALLWEKGHIELSGLMTVLASSNVDEMAISGTGPRAKITRVQMDELAIYYPYARALSTKKATKPPNCAVVAIDSIANMLNQRDWILTLPAPMMQQIPTTPNAPTKPRYSCPGAIKILLAALVLQIAKRQ